MDVDADEGGQGLDVDSLGWQDLGSWIWKASVENHPMFSWDSSFQGTELITAQLDTA